MARKLSRVPPSPISDVREVYTCYAALSPCRTFSLRLRVLLASTVGQGFCIEDVARLFAKLAIGLGFRGGYVTQGGDIGSK